MKNFLSLLEIKTLLIDVSEEITKKSLKQFCETQLILNSNSYSYNDFLFCNYLEESKKYFIVNIENKEKKFIFDVFTVIPIENNKYTLFVCDDAFYIYKEKSIYYFQRLNYKLDILEIEDLIFEKLKIEINYSIYVSNDELKSYKKEYISKKKTTKINNLNRLSNNKKQFTFFALYTLILISILSYLFFPTQKKEIIVKIEEPHEYEYISKKLVNIQNKAEKYNLKLIEIIKNRKITYKILSKNKNDIYNFLNNLEKDILSSTITFDDSLNIYRVEINVKSY